MSRREWLAALAYVLFVSAFWATGHIGARALMVMLVVPVVLLGMHYHERFSPRLRAWFLAFLWVLFIAFAVLLAWRIRRNLVHIFEWDFVGFWLHARTAVLGLSFYDPHNAQQLAATMQLSESFHREIVDVGFWYPPPSIFLFWPLGWFELPTALALWSAFLVAVMVASILLLWRGFFARGSVVELLGCATLVGAAQGTWENVNYSQTTFVALLALLLYWKRRDGIGAGAWVAIASLVKPFMCILIFVPLFGRLWRVVSSFAITIVVLALLSIAAVGWRTFADYLMLGPVGAKPDWIFSELINQSLLGLILRASHTKNCGSMCITNPVFMTVATMLGGITLLAGWRMARACDEWALSLWLLLALLIYPVSQVCYSVLLIPPLLLVWRERERIVGGPWPVALGTGVVYGLMVNAAVFAYLALWTVFVFVRPSPAQGPHVAESHR